MTYTTKEGVKVVLKPKDRNEPALCNGCYFSEPSIDGAPGRCSLPEDGSVPEDISLGCFKSVHLSIWVLASEPAVTADSSPLSIPQGRAPGVDSQMTPESASREDPSCQACTRIRNIKENVSHLEDLLTVLQTEIEAYKKQLGLIPTLEQGNLTPSGGNPLSIPRPGTRVEAVLSTEQIKPKVITNEEHYGCKSYDKTTIAREAIDQECNYIACNDCRLFNMIVRPCDSCYDIWDSSPYGMPLDKRIPYEGPAQ